MSGPPPWADILALVPQLSPDAQGALALLCAERLIASDPDLGSSLSLGWRLLAGQDVLEPVASALGELDEREDLDDNEVAATSYALTACLGAASGQAADPAGWTVMRVIDAAFDVAFDADPGGDPSEGGDLAQDASGADVQRELSWLRGATFSLKRSGPTDAVIASIRG